MIFNRLEHLIPPPVVALIIGSAMGLTAPYLQEFTLPLTPLSRQLLAGGVALTGLTCDLIALLTFFRLHTTINPMHPERSSTLATTGIYRFTRNPMYLGLVLLLTAWAIYLTAIPLLIGPLLLLLYLNRFQIGPEEQVMQQKFGAAYTAYTQQVRRWL